MAKTSNKPMTIRWPKGAPIREKNQFLEDQKERRDEARGLGGEEH